MGAGADNEGPTRLSLLSMIPAILLLIVAVGAAGAPGARTAPTGPIRIATWNLEWLNAREGVGEVPRHADDYAALAREARRLDADVVALQEVDGPAAARRVFDPSVYAFHFTGDADNPQRTGFAIRRNLVFSSLPDLEALAIDGTRRGADIEIRLGGRKVRLLSIHLKSGCWEEPLNPESRACATLAAQIPPLEGWIDARAREGAPFLVLGDFNRRFLPRDPFWTALDDGDPPAADLVDAAGFRASRCGGADPRMFIDHIVGGGPAAGWLIRDSFREQIYDAAEIRRGAVLSDHCPVWVRLDPDRSGASPIDDLPPVIRSDQASGYPGRVATVCGTVASSRYLDRTARRPTFLNLDSRPPEHRFTIVIWGKDRTAFGAPEVTLLGRRVCVTGLVSLFEGRPEVVATIPEQLRVER